MATSSPSGSNVWIAYSGFRILRGGISLVGYLFGAQAVGSDVSPDLVHRATFDDGIASDAKEGKFHGGTFPIWRYVHLMRLKII